MLKSFTQRLLLALSLLLAPAYVAAQLGSVPHSFTSGATISSADVNENFSTAYSNALNRTGGTMTGTLTARAIAAVADATYDLGASGVRFRDGFFSRNVTIAGTATIATAAITTATITTLTCTGCVDATQLAATAVSANSYGSATAIPTFTVDADGRLTAASSVAVVGFGTAASKATDGTVYTATTDGILVVQIDQGNYRGTTTVYSDAADPPTTVVAKASSHHQDTAEPIYVQMRFVTLTVPILKNKKFKIVLTDDSGGGITATALFYPFGS